jgi:hypothetical protein
MQAQTAPGPAAAVTPCGCLAPARWQCPVCQALRRPFVACSQRCLAEHRKRCHAHLPWDAPSAHARAQLRQDNRGHEANWDLYASHRLRLFGLLEAVQRSEGLCVLGAGNCDDLDLPWLVHLFGEVHLTDLDESALARGVRRVDAGVARRLVIHGGIDLSGLLASVESWGDHFPDRDGWQALEAEGLTEIRRGFRRDFDVVLSDCIVSQLCVSFYRLLVARPSEWRDLMESVARIHVGTMITLLRPGGTGVLIGDFPARDPGPGHGPVRSPSWDALAPALASVRDGVSLLRKPDFLMRLLATPPFAALIEPPRRTEPWSWTQAGSESIAYGILFRRRAD